TSDCRTLRRKRFPAIITATRTRHGRTSPDHHVSKLARRSALATIYLTIEDDPGADTFRDQHQDEISRVVDLGPAKPKFRQCNGIRVVVDHNRQTNCVRDRFRDGKIAPEEVRNVERVSRRWIDQTRKTHAYAFDRTLVP